MAKKYAQDSQVDVYECNMHTKCMNPHITCETWQLILIDIQKYALTVVSCVQKSMHCAVLEMYLNINTHEGLKYKYFEMQKYLNTNMLVSISNTFFKQFSHNFSLTCLTLANLALFLSLFLGVLPNDIVKLLDFLIIQYINNHVVYLKE